jgi:hypothetical protein
MPPMTSPSRAWFVGIALLAAVGCGSGTDDRPAKWSFISATITEPSCATVNCHSAITQKASVDLHDCRTGYVNLVNRNFVIPGNAAESSMVALMNAQGAQRMPPDVPLPEVDIALIERWINGGATYDCGN